MSFLVVGARRSTQCRKGDVNYLSRSIAFQGSAGGLWQVRRVDKSARLFGGKRFTICASHRNLGTIFHETDALRSMKMGNIASL
jgi:hypothetical protein